MAPAAITSGARRRAGRRLLEAVTSGHAIRSQGAGTGRRPWVDSAEVSAQQQPQQEQRSLYRRHRPRTFAEVVGQEPVVRTLRNAIERGKVHHALSLIHISEPTRLGMISY